MAAVLIISNATEDAIEMDDVLNATTGFGHTVVRASASLINAVPSILEGRDVIIVVGVENGSGTDESETLAGHILDLFSGTGHPGPETPGVLVCHPSNGNSFDAGDTVNNSVAIELGIIGAETRDDRAAGTYPADLADLADDWRLFPFSMAFGLDILAQDETGSSSPSSDSPTGSDLVPLVGASATYGTWYVGATADTITHLPFDRTPHAGKVFMRTDRKTGNGLPCGVAVRSGETLKGARSGTASEADLIWCGAYHVGVPEYGGFPAQLLNAMVEWLAGNVTETYPTTGTQRSVLFGVDLDGLGTLQGSSVAWTETTTVNTTVTVQTAAVEDGVVGAFGTISSSGDPIAGLSVTDDLTNVQVLVKVILDTTDGSETPELTDFKMTIRGSTAVLTATPTDQFRGGLLTWTSGQNEGLSQEVKDYDPSTQTLTFQLPAKKTIAVCDEFDILPGCQKRALTDCKDKFNNLQNFRGEPGVPGKDRLFDYPDST